MLNSREIQMIEDFVQHSSSFLSSNFFVEKYGISLRTIQSDIAKIRKFFQEKKYAEIESVASKGSRLLIHDIDIFNQEIIKITKPISNILPQTGRVQQLCILLLNQKKSIHRQFLINKLFVSSTTLSKDLSILELFLKEYKLILVRNSSGISIKGSEENKRKCLLNIGYLEHRDRPLYFSNIEEARLEIEKIVVSVLLKYKLHISEILFQNLIVHIEMTITRIEKGFSINKKDSYQIETELDIARDILSTIGKKFHINFKESEVVNLAIYIKGKSDYENDNYVSQEVNDFILSSLTRINEKFGIDFTQEMNFRISLALHLTPLIIRMEYNIQNHNQLLDHIKQSFPLAFDMALYMSLLLQQKTHNKVEEGEIAYLAIYFNQYLIEHNEEVNKQKILIITDLKRSESVLLRQRFTTWFPNEISNLKILSSNELLECNFDIEEYDVIFTTLQNELTEKMGAILISIFPSEAEYSKIKLAIDGFKDKLEIVSLFKEDLFCYEEFNSRNQIISTLCELPSGNINISTEKLLNYVQLREELGSSFFGNGIALPHPINPIATETFIAVALLKKEVEWDSDNNKVRLVMLVVIEKNNAKVFQLWNYLSKIVQDISFTERLLENPSFENFQKELSNLLDKYI